jgi:20S proteasome alpha/beta subunit
VRADSGTTTIGVRYQGGVVLAADAAFRRGATVMARNSDRISRVGPRTLLAACGDVPSGDQFAAYLVGQQHRHRITHCHQLSSLALK